MPSHTSSTYSAPVQDIMHYEGKIWAVADLLLAAGIKQSDFPAYMMPFFALVMVEGRMLNTIKRVEQEYGITAADDTEAFKTLYDAEGCGYNEYVVMQGKTLQTICRNDSTFEQDFTVYLRAFDDVLKQLLGIERDKTDQKFLNMDGIVAELRKKGILLEVTSAWAQIDLAPYDNSAITTLEEHIKRRWADISASTAGEQYTPEDIIELIARIVALKVSKPKDKLLHGYDPTCGGANLLYGVSDRLQQQGYKHIKTYGSELNDALYALAAIESRFRDMSVIKYGNTLTSVPFVDMEGGFDFIVANPPYGTKWKGYEREVKNDRLGQFPAGLPSISDGQLLFMQHILWQLSDSGIAVEVHNGSTLFSGDAGSGESNIRKYIFDRDWVEAIIQMPQQEFFNTGIYTYLWIMNKNKPHDRQSKVALIDGSSLWQPLKKSKGDKRREMSQDHQQQIVEALAKFEPSSICKIYDREHFYYNKQSLTLTEVSEEGKHVAQTVCKKGKAFVIKRPKALIVDKRIIDTQELTIDELKSVAKQVANAKLSLALTVETEKDGNYDYDPAQRTILHKKTDGTVEDLGCGAILLKLTRGKDLTAHKFIIEPYTTSDYEIIPHHLDAAANAREIEAFMARYITKPFVLGTNTIGVEINFNKEFYVPEKLDKVEDILNEIAELDKELGGIEAAQSMDSNLTTKPSGVDWIGDMPEGWEIKRIKELGNLRLGKMLTEKPVPGFHQRPYLKSKNIDWLKLKLDSVEEMFFSDSELTTLRLNKNDLVISEGGEVGKTAIWQDEIRECYIQNSVHKLTLGNECNPKYYLYLFYNLGHMGYFKSIVNLVSIMHLTYEKLRRVEVPVPKLEEQNKIAAYLDDKCARIDAIVANIEKQIEKYKALKRALIDEVITGKRTV